MRAETTQTRVGMIQTRHKPTTIVGHDWTGDVIKVMESKDGGRDGEVQPNPSPSASPPPSISFLFYY